MSASSVSSISLLFMAEASMRQSVKSGRFFLSLNAVSNTSLSCMATGWISSLWAMALMPRATFSGVSAPSLMYFAPLAASSKRVIWLMHIGFFSVMNLIRTSVGSPLIDMPIAGRRYVVSMRIFKVRFRPSLRGLFVDCGILRG